MPDNEHHVEEALRHTRALKTEAEGLVRELRAAGEDVRRALDLKGRMDRHPYLTMLAAAGVGYVVGGGLFTRFTARALHLGTRAVLLPMLRGELASLGEALGARLAREPAYAGAEDGEGGL